MKNKIFAATFFSLALLINTNQSQASIAGSVGVNLDLPENFFVEGGVFANYYGGDIIDYNYGAKGNLGYKMFGALAYGLGGVQHSGFANDQAKNFKDDTSPIYGFGVGYNFPLLSMGVRVEQTYFSLDRKDGRTKRFENTSVGVAVIF